MSALSVTLRPICRLCLLCLEVSALLRMSTMYHMSVTSCLSGLSGCPFCPFGHGSVLVPKSSSCLIHTSVHVRGQVASCLKHGLFSYVRFGCHWIAGPGEICVHVRCGSRSSRIVYLSPDMDVTCGT